MKAGEAVFLAVAVGITGAGLLATVRATGRRTPRAAPARWTIVTDALRSALGPVGAFYAVAVASVLPLILLVWPLGAWTRYNPLLSWNKTVLHAYDSGRNHTLTSAMKLFTQMGNWYQIVTVALVASALLAFASKTKRWLPPLVIISTLLGERYLQKAITAICKVHHPPTDLGTYPSGGVARLVAIYGIVGFMALRALAPRSRRSLVGGLWLLTLLTWIESYSRIHLQKHWFFDAIGGLLLGAGILVVAVAASTLLPWPEIAEQAEAAANPRHRGAGKRRRQRQPMRVRPVQSLLTREDVGVVILDGIAENGDPALLGIMEVSDPELLDPVASTESSIESSIEPSDEPAVSLVRPTRLRRVARSANGTPTTPQQPTGEADLPAALADSAGEPVSESLDPSATAESETSDQESTGQDCAEPTKSARARKASQAKADLVAAGPAAGRRRRTPKT